MASIQILVGSVYGGALRSANAIKAALEQQGHNVQVLDKASLEDISSSACPLLVCSSTTGQGEIPPNLLPFYLSLREQLPQQPGRPFGVIVFGDSSFGDTFCGAGELLEEALLETGAHKVGDTLQVDALETVGAAATAEAVAWARNWVSLISV
ncbi:flavodoxin domain-containing protein [Marinobacter sp. X15-166B]|uniref:flavodoxin domain-containing protein n=1 Tax=Marinobacter sp. X15-166B TaxID=1897620 RepID=UPI00085BB719|nr:flavodoxin domain-containing protein [Marinobacter sp. X15-166B]OEY65761.1 flavodoxin [Marinobacter sp. X15-166B]